MIIPLYYLYRVGGKTMPVNFAKNLSQFLVGMKRTVAKNREESGQEAY